MRKSRILTFLFALWPGAGQMYLGYMKRGVSLMLLFCLLMAISSFTGFGVFIFLLPIVWFYGFFDTINLRSMSYEFLPQDDFLFHLDSINAPELVKFFQRRHLLAGVLLIILGVYILLQLCSSNFLLHLSNRPLSALRELANTGCRSSHYLAGRPSDSQHRLSQSNRGRLPGIPRRLLSPGKPISLTDERLCNREGFPVTQSPPPFLFPKGRCYHVKSE